MFISWLKKQLFEPTAWLCFIIGLVALFTRTDTMVFWLCVIGILMPEDAVKAYLAEKAPTLSKKIDEWTA